MSKSILFPSHERTRSSRDQSSVIEKERKKKVKEKGEVGVGSITWTKHGMMGTPSLSFIGNFICDFLPFIQYGCRYYNLCPRRWILHLCFFFNSYIRFYFHQGYSTGLGLSIKIHICFSFQILLYKIHNIFIY